MFNTVSNRVEIEGRPGVASWHAMRRLLAVLLASVLIAGSQILAVGGAPLTSSHIDKPEAHREHPLSPRQRAEIFETVWRIVSDQYYDSALNGVDWPAIRERYRPLLDRITTDNDFYTLLKRMVGELHDAHTRFHTPEERREREKDQAISIGLTVGEVEGKPVVTSVDSDSEAARAGVEAGMFVLAIDSRPIAERLAEARSRVAGTSSDRATQIRIYRMILDGDPGTKVSLRLAADEDRALDVSLTRQIVRDDPEVTTRRLQSGAAYLRLTLWQSPVRKKVRKALKSFADAPGLILDLRGNPGGEAEEVVKIASYFFNSHVPFGKFTNRNGRSIYLRTDEDDEIYRGPIAIIVNEGSGSGSELFAGVMQETGRAIVIGRQTCGCVLGISRFRKFGEGELAVSEFGYLSPGGKSYEGVGITPDKIVPLTIADLRQHRDSALEEAQQMLKTSSKLKASASLNH